MLNRRFIRVKAMQCLFSHNDTGQSKQHLLDFFTSSSYQAYLLYNFMWLFYQSFFRSLKTHLEISTQKKIPKKEDCSALEILKKNILIKTILETPATDRKDIHDSIKKKEFPHKILRNLIDEFTPNFVSNIPKYNQSGNEIEICTDVYKNYIAPNISLYDFIEDQYITWNTDYPLVNALILKSIESFGSPNPSFERINSPFKNELDKDYATKLISYVVDKNDDLEAHIKSLSLNWDFSRISALDLIILKLGISEVLLFENIPSKVTLNEYIDIAKDFSTTKSHSFINGILDRFIKTNAKI